MAEHAKIATKAPETKRKSTTPQIRKPELSQSMDSPVDRILFLQRTVGNQAVQRMMKSGTLQAKFRIGQPNDKYEQEADRVAGQVMRIPEPQIQRQPEEEEKEELQTKPLAEQLSPLVQRQVEPEEEEEEEPIQTIGLAEQITPFGQRQVEEEEEEEPLQTNQTSGATPWRSRGLEARLHSLRGSGQSLPESVRAFFEPRFGYDLSQVRVHTNAQAADSARAVNARAFTVGRDVIFSSGQYAPHTTKGKQLLAHELTHTIQQRGHFASSAQHVPLPITRIATLRIQCLRGRGLVSREVQEILRQLRWLRTQITRLERERTLTTEEAERYRERIDALTRETRALGRHREVTRAEARRIWQRGRRLLREAGRFGEWVRWRRQIAARGRSTRGLRLISDFQVRPPVIRVHEGEAARISFILQRPARSIAWYILSREVGEPTSYCFFRTRNTNPGYKYALWNGTWEGLRNRPPETGTYRVRLSVTDRGGRTEEVFDQIRVENPQRLVVHPRHGSGYALRSLVFDGRTAVLSDARGNTIRMRAVSGLKRHHRLNRQRIDYTQSRYQWVPDRGPLPEGTYTIRRGAVQHPELQQGALRFPPRGASARVWGAIRVPLEPNVRRRGSVVRSEFFVHLDVNNDGTAGCIGIHPGDEGKFNNMMSLLGQMPDNLPVIVGY